MHFFDIDLKNAFEHILHELIWKRNGQHCENSWRETLIVPIMKQKDGVEANIKMPNLKDKDALDQRFPKREGAQIM